MAFSIGIGDIIKVIEVVGTVIDALQASSRAGNEYRALLQQLYDLETALHRVRRLDVEDLPTSEVQAMKAAACHCQQTIDEFLKKARSYDAPLRGTSANGFRANWYKIKWAIIHHDDIRKFKSDLFAHTEAIQLLLSTIQLSKLSITSQNQKTLASRIQESYSQTLSKLGAICTIVSLSVQQGKQLLASTAEILRINIRIFQAVIHIQNIITHIPAQIERQQPVFLIDALGKSCPFYIEFIRSAPAFKDVLMRNFEEVGAADKIRNDEFVITDVSSMEDLDLSTEWATIFMPGQRLKMSMEFFISPIINLGCPVCNAPNAVGIETECNRCGRSYSIVKTTEAGSLQQELSYEASGDDIWQVGSYCRNFKGEQNEIISSVSVGPERFRNVRLKHTLPPMIAANTGEQSTFVRFACTECSESFERQSDLRLHQTSVHGESMLLCLHCDRKLSRPSHWIEHLRNIHGCEPKGWACVDAHT